MKIDITVEIEGPPGEGTDKLRILINNGRITFELMNAEDKRTYFYRTLGSIVTKLKNEYG